MQYACALRNIEKKEKERGKVLDKLGIDVVET